MADDNLPDVDEIKSLIEEQHKLADEALQDRVTTYREFLEQISQIPPDDATAAQFAVVRRLATFLGERAIDLMEQIRERDARFLKLTIAQMERDASPVDFSAIGTATTG